MAVFEYTAIAEDGKRQTGLITADSPRSARRELRMRRLSPLDINTAREKKSALSLPGVGAVSSGDLVLVTRQLAMLIKSGSTIEEALGTIASQAERAGTKRVLLDLRGQLQEGYSFSDALARAPRSFPDYYRAVVASGLSAGRLGDVLERLATHLEKSRKLTGKITAALIYPAVLGVVAMIVVALLMIFVVPAVVEQFDTLDQDLPALTEAVIAISNFMRNWGLVTAISLFIVFLAFGRFVQAPSVRLSWHKFKLGIPILGKVFRSVNSAQFARTFATLSGSGATVPDALQAASGSVSNEVFKKAAKQIRREVEEGGSLSTALRSSAIFPPMLVHMVSSGERGSDLPNMMGLAADYIEEELDRNSTVALGLLEPAMIVLLAGVVAAIVLAIMLPILQLNSLAIAA
ncbi:MAG: type II secretion system inner membrane protein GspF [Pseudomonadota bacterium]